MNTSTFDFRNGFQPPPDFFTQPYVLGFSVMTFGLMRNFLFKGKDWSTGKSGEFLLSALEQFMGSNSAFDPESLNKSIMRLQSDPMFQVGKAHAETNFGAIFGLLRQSDNDPLVLAAREMAQDFPDVSAMLGSPNSDPDAGFKMAIMHLTVKAFLEESYPEI